MNHTSDLLLPRVQCRLDRLKNYLRISHYDANAAYDKNFDEYFITIRSGTAVRGGMREALSCCVYLLLNLADDTERVLSEEI